VTSPAYTSPAYDYPLPPETAGQAELKAIAFDETDGAYAVAEPDPFAEPAAAPAGRPSLRVELGSAPAVSARELARPLAPPLPVRPELAPLLPDGLRRGSTVAVTGSVSLLLSLLAGPSAHGAWVALVGMPAISAESAAVAGVRLRRLAVVGPPSDCGWTSSSFSTAVGALLDAVDIVVARPGCVTAGAARFPAVGVPAAGIASGDARRLTARTRSKQAVLMLFGQQSAGWPAVEVRLSAEHGRWHGIGDGYGRITSRQLFVTATGRGRSARCRTAELRL